MRAAVLDFARTTGAETGHEEEIVRVIVKEGLGQPWPLAEPRGPRPIGEGAPEHVKRLLDGEDVHTLGRTEQYPEGAFHVTVKADLG